MPRREILTNQPNIFRKVFEQTNEAVWQNAESRAVQT